MRRVAVVSRRLLLVGVFAVVPMLAVTASAATWTWLGEVRVRGEAHPTPGGGVLGVPFNGDCHGLKDHFAAVGLEEANPSNYPGPLETDGIGAAEFRFGEQIPDFDPANNDYRFRAAIDSTGEVPSGGAQIKVGFYAQGQPCQNAGTEPGCFDNPDGARCFGPGRDLSGDLYSPDAVVALSDGVQVNVDLYYRVVSS